MKNILFLLPVLFLLIACDKTDPQDTIRVNKDEFLETVKQVGNCPRPTVVECLGLYSESIAPKNKMVCSGEASLSRALSTCISNLNLCQTGSGYILQ